MVGIYYLRLTQLAQNTGSKIHNHYIYMYKNKFLVMTSNPVPGMKSKLINNVNIVGEDKTQYIIEHIHIYDAKKHILDVTIKGLNYYIQNYDTFQGLI